MRYVFATLMATLMLAAAVSAEYSTTASAVKGPDGKWTITFPINDWQSNPEMAVKEPAKKGELIQFGSAITVCATVYVKQDGKTVQLRKGNEMLVTTVDWSTFTATAILAVPEGTTEFMVRLYARAAKGDAPAINGALHLNQKDPAYTEAGYELACSTATGKSKAAKG